MKNPPGYTGGTDACRQTSNVAVVAGVSEIGDFGIWNVLAGDDTRDHPRCTATAGVCPAMVGDEPVIETARAVTSSGAAGDGQVISSTKKAGPYRACLARGRRAVRS